MGMKSGAFLVCGRFGLTNSVSSVAGDPEAMVPGGESVLRCAFEVPPPRAHGLRARLLVVANSSHLAIC
jgi:hypothetical protein